jgi:PAS domain S-box-containing protein
MLRACPGRVNRIDAPDDIDDKRGTLSPASVGFPIDDAGVKEWLWAFALQSLDYGIFLLSTDRVVQWVNPGAAWILGCTVQDIVGQPLDPFFTPEDAALGIPQHERNVAVSQGSSDDDRWMQRADGSRFWAAGRTVALRNADGKPMGLLKILRDLTDIKMRITTLTNRVEALGLVDAARIDAIATLSHELRNPLASISMAAAVLGKLVDGPSAQSSLEVLQRNVGFATRMVEDLEQSSRAAVGKLRLEWEPLQLDTELRAAIATAKHQTAAQDRDVELLLPGGQPISIEADRLRLQQVFVNLIVNAIKFTSGGGQVWVTATVEARHAVIRIEDNGAGISPEMLESIFGMFTQVGRPTVGLGIGLALVKNIVELHGGTVQARSDGLGKGSTFTVRLPLAAADRLPPPESPPQPAQTVQGEN